MSETVSLAKRELRLLSVASKTSLLRNAKIEKAFDRLLSLGLIDASGDITAQGADALNQQVTDTDHEEEPTSAPATIEQLQDLERRHSRPRPHPRPHR